MSRLASMGTCRGWRGRLWRRGWCDRRRPRSWAANLGLLRYTTCSAGGDKSGIWWSVSVRSHPQLIEKKSPFSPRESTLWAVEPQPNTMSTRVPGVKQQSPLSPCPTSYLHIQPGTPSGWGWSLWRSHSAPPPSWHCSWLRQQLSSSLLGCKLSLASSSLLPRPGGASAGEEIATLVKTRSCYHLGKLINGTWEKLGCPS